MEFGSQSGNLMPLTRRHCRTGVMPSAVITFSCLLLCLSIGTSQSITELKAEHRTADVIPDFNPLLDFEPVEFEETPPAEIFDTPFKKEDLIRPLEGGPPLEQKETFLEDFQETLQFLEKVAGKFLELFRNSDLDREFSADGEYTLFVPRNGAIQAWHPIDWGFYPFIVPEFTRETLLNHFVKGKWPVEALKEQEQLETLGGKILNVRADNDTGKIYLNDIPLLLEETPVSHGTLYFVDNLFFVNSEIVRSLNDANRDKESGPLLGSPWPDSQFLSHLLLELEDREGTSLFGTYLNSSRVSDQFPTRRDGKHLTYTGFIPRDSAINSLLESAGWSEFRDPFELDRALNEKMMLNHFVPGYHYAVDFVKPEGVTLTSMSGDELVVKSVDGKLTVNDIPIVESDAFVYDLGNMYIIDGVIGITKDDVNASMTRVPLPEEEAVPTHEVIEAVLSALNEREGDFSRLKEYFLKTDMAKELDEATAFPGIYTVFAPTDAAFKEIVSDHLPDPFSGDAEFRKTSLLNFIVPKPLNVFELDAPIRLETLGGQSLTVHKHEGNVILLTYGQNTLTIDPLKKLVIPEGVGLVFPVDKVPFITATDVNNAIENLAVMESSVAADVAARDSAGHSAKHPFVEGAGVALDGQTGLSKMRDYWKLFGVSAVLEEGSPYTMIAVKNDVLTKLEKDGEDPIAVDEFIRERILKRMVAKGDLDVESAEDGQTFETLGGSSLIVKKSGDLITLNGAAVDLESSGEFGNGAGRLLVLKELPFKVSEKEIISALRRRCNARSQYSSEFFREIVNALKGLPQFSSIVSYIQCNTIPGETVDSRLPLTFFAPSNTAIHFALPADAIDPFVSNGAFRDSSILKHITEALTFEDLEEPRNVTSLGGHLIKFTVHSPNLVRANNVLVDQDGEISLGDLGRIIPVRGLLIPLTDVDDAIGQEPAEIPFKPPQQAEALLLDQPAASSTKQEVVEPLEKVAEVENQGTEDPAILARSIPEEEAEIIAESTTTEAAEEATTESATEEPTDATTLAAELDTEPTTEAETEGTTEVLEATTVQAAEERLADPVMEREQPVVEAFPLFLNMALLSLEDSPKNKGPSFSRLVQYMRMTDFSDVLPASSTGPYTLLAPTDSGFMRGLPADATDVFLANAKFRKNAMLNMIVPGKITSPGMIKALGGPDLEVTETNGKFSVNKRELADPMVLPDNLGFVYPMDLILAGPDAISNALSELAPQRPIFGAWPLVGPVAQLRTTTEIIAARDSCQGCSNFVDILAATLEDAKDQGSFEEFLSYVKASDLEAEFPEQDGNGSPLQYTAFIPTDGAVRSSLFQDVPNPFVAEESADFRRNSMLQHFVRGKIDTAFLPPGSVFSSLNGFAINIKKSADESNGFTVNEYIRASLPPIVLPKNAGVVYIIDRILTPSSEMSAALQKIPFISPFSFHRGPSIEDADEPRLAAPAGPPAPPSRTEEITFKILKDIGSVLAETGKHKSLAEYLSESMESLMLEDLAPGVTFIAPNDEAFEKLLPSAGVLDPFITNPGFRVDTIKSLIIGPPPVDLRNFEGSVAVQDKSYKVSKADGNLTINGITVLGEPTVLPGDEGFVFFVGEVPFLTAEDLTEALRRPRPPPRTRANAQPPLPPGVAPPAPPPASDAPSDTNQGNSAEKPRSAARLLADSPEIRILRPIPPPAMLLARNSAKKLRQLDTDDVTFVYEHNGKFLNNIQVISRGQRIRQQGGSV